MQKQKVVITGNPKQTIRLFKHLQKEHRVIAKRMKISR